LEHSVPDSKPRLDEGAMSERQAAGLVAAQFPHWAQHPLALLPVGGSENTLIRMGQSRVLRFPRGEGAALQVAVEARWLPVLAPLLPLAVPQIAAVGTPGPGFAYPWLVLHWLPGDTAAAAPVADDLAAARTLARFVQALQAIPVPAALPRMTTDRHLRARDDFTRQMIALITDEADPQVATRCWDAALLLPEWQGAPVVVHADLHPLNLLTSDGNISAVIDWGRLCAGDPAHDLICGWMVLQDAGRALFRTLLHVDDTTWARARALAFSKALMAAPYHRTSNRPLHRVMRTALRRCIADWPG
jgi:aminoglycoside phosphotransferase (APT) family kinase protein